ncbi:MAG: hypothetical protein ACREJ0_24995, partial [Geminicoccaceae bacterium]
MMLDAGAVQAQGMAGTCSFTDQTSVWGGCRTSPNDRQRDQNGVAPVRASLPVNGVVQNPQEDGNGNGNG